MKSRSLVEMMENAAAGAYGDDSAVIGKLAGIINAAMFERSIGPFICGALGEPGTDGLHESYMICPCYGADVQNTAIYQRKK